ncbi:MAG: FAD-dependent oxidoreductase [Clostridia bacterium]
MKIQVIQEQLQTPVLGEYDVIIAGGGVAGVCAAVAARRAGVQRVLLLEKGILFGGLATQGLIALYEPICDGQGRKVTYGMGAELMQLCMKYGPDVLPEQWRSDPDAAQGDNQRYKTFFSPTMFAMALDEFVLDAGVEVLFDTQVVRPVMDGVRCIGLVVENKNGRGMYKAKAIVDTTGDADICCRAGVPCVTGQNYMTFMAYRADMEAAGSAIVENNILKARKWTLLGAGPRGNGHPENVPLIAGTTAKEVTKYVLDGRRMMLESMRGEDRFARDISMLPTMPQLRTTRHIRGAYALQELDVCTAQTDSVGVVADFQTPGEWYELPYRALYDPAYPNLWTAGRTAAAEGWAWSAIRVIPGAACSGQAVGIAAALCVRHGLAAYDLPYAMLLDVITAEGGRVHAGQACR